MIIIIIIIIYYRYYEQRKQYYRSCSHPTVVIFGLFDRVMQAEK